MAQICWGSLQRRTLPRAYRGPLSSVLMKTIRLAWPEDALYWLTVMYKGAAGGPSLARRIFRSSGEDNLDIGAIVVAEDLLRRTKAWKSKRDELEALQWALPFYDLMIERGRVSPSNQIRIVAHILERQSRWLASLDDRHHLRQLIWGVCRGPFDPSGRQPTEEASGERWRE